MVHYHFRSKEHLLIEAQRSTFRQIHERFEDRFRRGERGLDTAAEAFEALWTAVLDMKAWTPFMVEVLSLTTHDTALREHADDFEDEVMGRLERGIEQLFADDLDRLRVPPARLARLIRIHLHGLVVELAHARTESDLQRTKQAADDFKDHMLATLFEPQGDPS